MESFVSVSILKCETVSPFCAKGRRQTVEHPFGMGKGVRGAQDAENYAVARLRLALMASTRGKTSRTRAK